MCVIKCRFHPEREIDQQSCLATDLKYKSEVEINECLSNYLHRLYLKFNLRLRHSRLLGVKVIMPSVHTGLDLPCWRQKCN